MNPRETIRGMRILVVDDDPDVRTAHARLLSRWGAQVETAGSVREALLAFQRSRPDVIVSDIGMPGADGCDLVCAIRSLSPEAGGLTPAVAVTGYRDPGHRERAFSAGFEAYLVKPVEVSDLLAVLALIAPASLPVGPRLVIA